LEGLLYKNIPAFTSYRGDCIRTAMLSALHTLEPGNPVTLKHLRNMLHGTPGTGINEACVLFNLIGLNTVAYASSFERVPPLPSFISRDMEQELYRKEQATLTASDIKTLMRDHLVIPCVEVSQCYPGGMEVGHAFILTGFTQKHFVYHETIWPAANRPAATPNSVMELSRFERGHAAHDHHTLVIGHKTADFLTNLETLKEQAEAMMALRRSSASSCVNQQHRNATAEPA